LQNNRLFVPENDESKGIILMGRGGKKTRRTRGGRRIKRHELSLQKQLNNNFLHYGEFVVKGTEEFGWKHTWFVSPTRSHHVTSDKGLIFDIFDNHKDITIKEGNRHFMFEGKGSAIINTNGEAIVVNSVHFMPRFNRNVLSLRQLGIDGFNVTIMGMVCYLKKASVDREISDQKLKNTRCFVCGFYGHFQNRCNKDDEVLLMAKKESNRRHLIDEESWVKNKSQSEQLWDYFEQLDLERIKEENKTNEGKKMEIYPRQFVDIKDCMHFLELVEKHINFNVECFANEERFNQMLKCFYKNHMNYKDFRPIPPIDREGYAINLLKLYMAVKEMGGFEAVSSWDAWEEVSIKIGHRDIDGDRLKDVYEKYLEVIGWFGDKIREEKIEVKVGDCSKDYAGYDGGSEGEKGGGKEEKQGKVEGKEDGKDGDGNEAGKGDQIKPLKKRKHGKEIQTNKA
jgi:hypothetical protein